MTTYKPLFSEGWKNVSYAIPQEELLEKLEQKFPDTKWKEVDGHIAIGYPGVGKASDGKPLWVYDAYEFDGSKYPNYPDSSTHKELFNFLEENGWYLENQTQTMAKLYPIQIREKEEIQERAVTTYKPRFTKESLEEKKLTYAQKKALPKSDFVYPKERKYPIPDESHARNALARVAQSGTDAEKKRVKAAVHKKFPKIGKKEESTQSYKPIFKEESEVPEFRIVDHGVEHAQYFQGHGTSFTKWDESITGHGMSPKEAIDDALEQLAGAGIKLPANLDDFMNAVEKKAKEMYGDNYAKNMVSEVQKKSGEYETEEDMETSELYYYVSIDYMTGKKDIKESAEDRYKKFLGKVGPTLGIGYHPDTPFSDYVEVKSGKPTYSKEEAEQLDKERQEHIKALGDKVYDIGFEDMKRKYGPKGMSESYKPYKPIFTEALGDGDPKPKDEFKGVKVYDNGGETVDRYTIFTPDGFVYGASQDPFHPQGFGQFVGETEKVNPRSHIKPGSHLGKRIDPKSTPEKVQQYIRQMMKED